MPAKLMSQQEAFVFLHQEQKADLEERFTMADIDLFIEAFLWYSDARQEHLNYMDENKHRLTEKDLEVLLEAKKKQVVLDCLRKKIERMVGEDITPRV